MSTVKANPAILERIKRSELPQAEVYVAEKPPLKNLNSIGDDDFPMEDEESSFPKRAARTNPVLFERLREQESIASMDLTATKEEEERGGELQVNSYTKLMLGGVLGFLLILALRHNDLIKTILKKLF